MSDVTTCKIDSITKDRLEYTAKCMKIRRNELNSFYSHQYVINRLITEYLDKINIQPMKDNITEMDIKGYESYLKKNRIDVDLKKTTKDDYKALGKALLKKNMVDRKMNYNDIAEFLLKKFLEHYPEFIDELLDYRYIKQQEGLKEFRRQHNVH